MEVGKYSTGKLLWIESVIMRTICDIGGCGGMRSGVSRFSEKPVDSGDGLT